MSRQKPVFVAAWVEGQFAIHGPPVDGNYDTLCALDTNDPAIGHLPADLPKRAKITCGQCLKIFNACRQLRASDFEVSP